MFPLKLDLKKILGLSGLALALTAAAVVSGCAKDNSSSSTSKPASAQSRPMSGSVPLVPAGSSTSSSPTGGLSGSTTNSNAPTYNYADYDHDTGMERFNFQTLYDAGLRSNTDVQTLLNDSGYSKDDLKQAFSDYLASAQAVVTKYGQPFYISGYSTLQSLPASYLQDVQANIQVVQRDLLTLNSL